MHSSSNLAQVRLRLACSSDKPHLPVIDSQIQKILARLRKDLCQHHRVTDLAKELEISPRQFERRFKVATEYSYRQYMKKIRLEKASELLATTKWGIKRISVEIGLKTVHHFSADFKQRYKLTPTEYRKRMFGKWRDVAFGI